MTKSTDQTPRRGLSRRQILKASAGNGRLPCRREANFPPAAFAQGQVPSDAAKLGSSRLAMPARLFVARIRSCSPNTACGRRSDRSRPLGHHRDNLCARSEAMASTAPYPDADAVPDFVRQVTQNNQPTPMYILARLNLDAQWHLRSPRNTATKNFGVDTAPFKIALEKRRPRARPSRPR